MSVGDVRGGANIAQVAKSNCIHTYMYQPSGSGGQFQAENAISGSGLEAKLEFCDAIVNRDPIGRQVHVDQNLHDNLSGTSISSLRQAAYARAA